MRNHVKHSVELVDGEGRHRGRSGGRRGLPTGPGRTRRGINRNDGRAVKEGLFYVRRHTCADGSFEWYVLNGHTRRPASKLFRTRAAAAAERARLQVKLELAKEQVLKRTP